MCIKCSIVHLSADMDSLEPELKRIARLIHDGKLQPGQIDQAMTKKIADQLMKGVFKGYGKDLSSKSLTESERTFLGQLQENVYIFSGFKNYQQLKETTLQLKTDDGAIKPFNEFLNDVKTINSTYNEVYLAAEYSNALASAQMAQAWQDFESNGVEMLTYQTANDDRVREDHAIMEGITLPVDDPFWSTYYPPNDWGCRCDAVPSAETKEVKIPASSLPDIPEMFQNNVGKSGIIFPDTHPYFNVSDRVAKDVLEQISSFKMSDDSAILNDSETFKSAVKAIEGSGLIEKYPDLSIDELAAVHTYSDGSFYDLNRALRANKVSEYQAALERTINNALEKMPADKSPIYFRGTKISDEALQRYVTSQENNSPVLEPAFTSTTKDFNVAKGFEINVNDSQSVIFHITGQTGRDISALSKFGENFSKSGYSEQEVLFKSSSNFWVRGIEKNGGLTNIYLDEKGY